MWFFDDVADWWDEQKQKTEEILTDFVAGTNSWWRIAIAGTVQTAMNLGGGFVDVLRLGEGIKEGGWRGFAQDGLRLLTLAGPAARAGRSVSRFFAPNPRGPICGWVTATQALRQTGVKHFATVEDLVQATGRSASPGGVSLTEADGLLRSLGAETRVMPGVTTMQEVAELARQNPNGVVMFGVLWGDDTGHALYAFRDMFFRVRIVDRTGRVVGNLSKLEDVYVAISSTKVGGAIVVKNSVLATTVTGAATIALEVRAAIAASRSDVDKKMDEIRRKRGHASAAPKHAAPRKAAKAATPPKGDGKKRHTVKAGETWLSIASQYTTPGGVPSSMLAGLLKEQSMLAGYTQPWEPPKVGSVLVIP
ncbi:MAG: hypothetical protein JST93_33300 [Acidobacteria bacterium]|nr:hypothetical protein [Acidobacteriota bacterium]